MGRIVVFANFATLAFFLVLLGVLLWGVARIWTPHRWRAALLFIIGVPVLAGFVVWSVRSSFCAVQVYRQLNLMESQNLTADRLFQRLSGLIGDDKDRFQAVVEQMIDRSKPGTEKIIIRLFEAEVVKDRSAVDGERRRRNIEVAGILLRSDNEELESTARAYARRNGYQIVGNSKTGVHWKK